VGLSIAIGAAMFGCSHLVGWVTVVALDNPLGQVLGTVLCFALSIPIATIAVNLNQNSIILSLGFVAIVVIGCVAAAATTEKFRWKFT
jgi:hypothetical protein